MKILAIETSCECASVALLADGEVIQHALEGHASHSEHLLPVIDRLLAEAQLSLSCLDVLAFGNGPGAFTGLRLACGVAQGLAMGADIGIVPVCSLAALAMQAVKAPRVLVATDARMNEVYAAAYRFQDGFPETAHEPVCLPPAQLTMAFPGEWYVIGSALRAYDIDLMQDGRITVTDAVADAYPQAKEVAGLAVREATLGRVVSPELAAPLYVRNKVALTAAEQAARKKNA